jgi:uracil-DNA glycosylase family 4
VALVATDRRDDRARRLADLARRVSSCSACPRLVGWREEAARNRPRSFALDDYWARPLAGFGDPAARLVVVGLAPAAHGGNRTGRMFTGDRSGDFLVAGLHLHGFANQSISIAADDGLQLIGAYVTAPVRCAPPANRPLPEERARCLPYLEEEIGLLGNAVVYLALGAYAFESLRRTTAFSSLRGRFAHGAEFALDPAPAGPARFVVCTYHPSQRNVFTGLLTSQMFSDVLARCRTLVDSP